MPTVPIAANPTDRALDRIRHRYNADFDQIPDGPAVTWAEYTLARAIDILGQRVSLLEQTRIDSLETIDRLEQALDADGETIQRLKRYAARLEKQINPAQFIPEPPGPQPHGLAPDTYGKHTMAETGEMDMTQIAPAIRQVAWLLTQYHSTDTWNQWIVYLLEHLDGHLTSESPELPQDILTALQADIQTRLDQGQW